MILKKKAKTFNDYTLECSFGQLEAMMASLERDHADPVADELFAELQWYMQRVPGPGEEEDEAKAREEGAVETGAATTGDVEGEDVPIPMPPAEGGAEGEEPPLPPGAEGEAGAEGGAGAEDGGFEGGENQLPPGEEAPPEGAPEGGFRGGAPGEGEDLSKLPAPPAE